MADTFKSIEALNEAVDLGRLDYAAIVTLENLIVSVLNTKNRVHLSDVNGDGIWADVKPGDPIVSVGDKSGSVTGEYSRGSETIDIHSIDY